MTISEAITKVDSLKHNAFSQEDKIGWLSDLDARIKTKIVDAHEGGETVYFYGYDCACDLDTELLAPKPFDEMYLRWLEAQIHYYSSDDGLYNNAIVLFNNIYEDFKKHYTRTHMPLSHGKRFVF